MIYKKQTLFYMVKRRGSVFKTSASVWQTVPDAWFMVDRWPLRRQSVRCGSTKLNSASHPLEIGLMSSNPCNYMDHGSGYH